MTNQSADIEASGVTSIMGGERYRPYPAYKDSGVEWLGEIPAHWEVKKLKHLVHISSGFTLPQSFDRYEGKYPVYGSNGRIGYCDRYLIANQAIVIGRVGASGTVNVVPERSWISDNALIVRIVGQTQLLWLRYILQAANLGEHAAKNAQPIITATFVGDQALATPTNSEQRAIAAFLDRETAKIDALVAKKERLIELFQEKRTALISHAVTKGLDPDAPLKDSGVEWLGEIPAHWEVGRLRTLVNIKTGGRDTVDQQEEGKYPFFVRSQTVERINTWSFDGEAVLTAGDGVGVGKVFHYVNGKFDYHQRVYKFSNFRAVMGRFFFYFFKEMLRFEVLQGTAKSTVDSLRLPMLQNFPVVVLPLFEQRAIVAFLDRETAKIDALVVKVQEAINRLNELRTALISAAVTGKIDVRETAT